MAAIRSHPIKTFLTPGVAQEARKVIGRAAAMGLVTNDLVQTMATDDDIWKAIQDVARRATEIGVGTRTSPHLRTRPRGGAQSARFEAALRHLAELLEESPVPREEIPELARTLGWPLLSRLANAAEVSLRRYASDQRQAPDDIASRIHWLALTVADLRGGYNDFGVRRWIERPRAQLDGRSPVDILTGDWSPEAPDVERTRALAEWVSEPTTST